MDFTDKVAIVTGGGRGIGKSCCFALLEQGCKVACLDCNSKTGEVFLTEAREKYNEERLIFISCDVTSIDNFRAGFQKTRDHFGRIDILVNNAGIFDEHNWEKEIFVNFNGVVHGINLAFEFMGIPNGGKGGNVVNVASIAGLVQYYFCPVYAGTKHAVVGLTKSYGHEYHYKKTGVLVNGVCPVAIDTVLFRAIPETCIDIKEGKDHVDVAHMISPDEVAKGVIQLINDGKGGALFQVGDKGTFYVNC